MAREDQSSCVSQPACLSVYKQTEPEVRREVEGQAGDVSVSRPRRLRHGRITVTMTKEVRINEAPVIRRHSRAIPTKTVTVAEPCTPSNGEQCFYQGSISLAASRP